MPTAVESAQLNLELFALRRDPALREARAWFLGEFHPATFEDFTAVASGTRNASVRMVLGYWDMAASLVTFGAIDAAMFRAAHTEIVATFAKVEPFLVQIRQVGGIPEFLQHMETVVRAMPGSAERLTLLQDQFRAIAKAGDSPLARRPANTREQPAAAADGRSKHARRRGARPMRRR
jgi:hypothetical protein